MYPSRSGRAPTTSSGEDGKGEGGGGEDRVGRGGQRHGQKGGGKEKGGDGEAAGKIEKPLNLDGEQAGALAPLERKVEKRIGRKKMRGHGPGMSLSNLPK